MINDHDENCQCGTCFWKNVKLDPIAKGNKNKTPSS